MWTIKLFILFSCVLQTISAACQLGWRHLEATNRCYFIVRKIDTFNQSIQFCIDIGGSLTSIISTEEISFFKGSFEYIWIGGIDLYRTGLFTWIDGQPWTAFSESLWAPGQPNNDGSQKFCTEYFGTGNIALQNCNATHWSLCSRPPNNGTADVGEIPPELRPNGAVEFTIAAAAVALNSLIVCFILFKTPPDWEDYRFFLFVITLSDLLLDFHVFFLMQPVPLFPYFGAIVLGPLRFLGRWLGAFTSIIGALFLFMQCLFAINVAFAYRCICLVKPHWQGRFLSRTVQVAIQICVFALSISVAAGWYFAMWDNDLNPIELTDAITHFPKLIVSNNVVVFVVVVNGRFNWQFYAYAVILVTGSCAFNIFLSYKILSHLRTHRASLPPSTHRLQILLTVCLLLQTFSPLILLSSPIVLLAITYYQNHFIAHVDDTTFRTIGQAFVIAIALHPLVNAICTLSFVQPYRQLLIRDEWLKKVRQFYRDCVTRRQTRVTSASTTTTVENLEMKAVTATSHQRITKAQGDFEPAIAT